MPRVEPIAVPEVEEEERGHRAEAKRESDKFQEDPAPAAPVGESKALSETDKAFSKLVEDTASMLSKFHSASLETYWDLGKSVDALLSDTSKNTYGSHSLDEFSKCLAKKGVNLGADSLRKSRQVATRVTRPELALATEVGMSWRNLIALTDERVTATQRQEVIDKIKAGELDQAKIPEYLVKRLKLREAKPAKKALTPLQSLRKVSGIANALLPQFDGLQETVKKFSKIAPEDREELLKEYKPAISDVKANLLKLIKGAEASLRSLEKLVTS